MCIRDSICGPIWGSFPVWGSFAVGDHLRRCTAVLSGSFVHAIEMIDVHQNSGFYAEARVKGFKAFQSSRICRICFKYSEKQIGFSLYNIHLVSNSSPRKRDFLHETGFSLPHRYHFFRIRIEANPVIYRHLKFFKWAWHLALWSRKRPKLVCCEAWWLRSNKWFLISTASWCACRDDSCRKLVVLLLSAI